MGDLNLFRSCVQETPGCRMTATHRGERQDALKAHVHPTSMPAGGGSRGLSFFSSLNGPIITLLQLTTRHRGFHGLIQRLN